VNTSALTKSAVAVALAAVAGLGIAACTAHAPGHADAKATASSAAAPTATSTPKAGVTTTMQCLDLESKLAGSLGRVQSALGTVTSGGDPSAALPQLQSFQKQLDTQLGAVTDPALRAPAVKLDADYDALVSTAKAASDAYAARNPSGVQAQAAKVLTEKSALEADVTALEGVCA